MTLVVQCSPNPSNYASRGPLTSLVSQDMIMDAYRGGISVKIDNVIFDWVSIRIASSSFSHSYG